MLNGRCWDDGYTIAQWLEHCWLQARVPGSSPGGDSRLFLQTFFPFNSLIRLSAVNQLIFAGDLISLISPLGT